MVVAGDGNCLLRCFGLFLYGKSRLYKQLRDIFIQFVVKERDRYCKFIAGEFEAWVLDRCQDAVWLGQICITGISEIYGFNIMLYDVTGASVKYYAANQERIKECCHLVFINNNHYNLKQDTSTNVLNKRYGYVEKELGFDVFRYYTKELLKYNKFIDIYTIDFPERPIHININNGNDDDDDDMSFIDLTKKDNNNTGNINFNNTGNKSQSVNIGNDNSNINIDNKIDDDSDIEIKSNGRDEIPCYESQEAAIMSRLNNIVNINKEIVENGELNLNDDIGTINNKKNNNSIGFNEYRTFYFANQDGQVKSNKYKDLVMTPLGVFCVKCTYYGVKGAFSDFGARSFTSTKQQRYVGIFT